MVIRLPDFPNRPHEDALRVLHAKLDRWYAFKHLTPEQHAFLQSTMDRNREILQQIRKMPLPHKGRVSP